MTIYGVVVSPTFLDEGVADDLFLFTSLREAEEFADRVDGEVRWYGTFTLDEALNVFYGDEFDADHPDPEKIIPAEPYDT